MNIPGLDAHYGDQPEPSEVCDACAFTDTHCGDCEQCCASVEDHPEIHPDPEPDCHKCTLVALTRVSMRVVELEAENERLRKKIQAVRDLVAENERLREKIQAVRDLVTRWRAQASSDDPADGMVWPRLAAVAAQQVEQALDALETK